MMEEETLDVVQTDGVEDRIKREKRISFGIGLSIGLLVAAAALTFSVLEVSKYKKAAGDILDLNTMSKISLLSEVIDRKFYPYDEAQDTSLEERRNGLYRGLVYSIGDIYAEYYTPEELEEALADSQGVYYGIGAIISFNDELNYPVFTRTMEGTPAEAAGIREGDVIIRVNGESTYGMNSNDTAMLVRGDEGTVVHLTVYREGEENYLTFDITRAKVDSISVGSKMLEDDIGYIAISNFEMTTIDQFKKAYDQLRADGAKGLIVDLRSNPGGVVTSVVEILRQILPEGIIYYEETAEGVRREEYCDGANEIDIPLVIMVNEYSASASEIFCGAVRDYGVGTLVGKKTYGKGIVQDTIPLSDGSAIKLTASSYFSPKGFNFQGVGIEPDVEVEFDGKKYYDEGIDVQLNKGIEVIKEKIKDR